MLDNSERKYKLGDRIECNGYFGTIKYIGLVGNHPSIWLGIDWDDPERGKHSGNVNGIHYFQARSPTSGSFVRPEKVDLGQSAVASIRTRYGHRDDDIMTKINQQQQLKFQQDINAPFVEMVGFEKVSNKQSDFNSLKIVNLRLQNVRDLGESLELRSLCPNIEELDLSKNLLASWAVIFEICLELDYLHWVNVSENLLEFPENYSDYNFPNIRTLVCGSMSLDSNDLVKITQIFPNLEELRAPNNSINSLTLLQENNVNCLKILDIEGNPIEEWSEICQLNKANSLEYLIAENIGLSCIRFVETTPKVVLLNNLKKLCITNNFIEDWESVGELNKLRKLEDLKFSKNPVLLKETKQMVRQLIIARIGNLKVLNGAIIDINERKGAEYDYIKKYGKEWLAVKGTEQEQTFLNSHNRYLELIQKYGEPEKSELVSESKILKTNLVNLQLIYGEKTIFKKLPPTILVQKLIMLVQKLFKLDSRPSLVYISNLQPHIQISLDDELKEIGLYSIQDQDQIVVNI